MVTAVDSMLRRGVCTRPQGASWNPATHDQALVGAACPAVGSAKGEAFACWHSTFAGPTADRSAWASALSKPDDPPSLKLRRDKSAFAKPTAGQATRERASSFAKATADKAGKMPFSDAKDFSVCATFCARVASFLEAVGDHWQIAQKVPENALLPMKSRVLCMCQARKSEGIKSRKG